MGSVTVKKKSLKKQRQEPVRQKENKDDHYKMCEAIPYTLKWQF